MTSLELKQVDTNIWVKEKPFRKLGIEIGVRMTIVRLSGNRSFPLLTQVFSRIISCYEELRPSIFNKLAIKERRKIATSVMKLLEWDFQRVIIAHGSIVEQNAKERLKSGYEWFLNMSL